jgi:hypothetical protein
MNTEITPAERIFKVRERVYFRKDTMGKPELDEIVKDAVGKYSAGPHVIIRAYISTADGQQKLEFRGPISKGLGEDAPIPSLVDKREWDSRYFTSTPSA